MFGVQGEYGVGVVATSPIDVVQEGKGRETVLGDHGPHRGATHL